MPTAIAAFLSGCWVVLRAPGVVFGLFAVTVACAAPLAALLASRLQHLIGSTALADPNASLLPIDAWDTIRGHADGILATFTPAILGFAVPLENISTVADAIPPPFVVTVAGGVYGALWFLFWGGVLERLAAGKRRGIGAFSRACVAWCGPMTRLGLIVLAAYGLLFAVLHPLIFGPLYEVLAVQAETEKAAFAMRIALYATFGALLLIVSVVADLTRVHIVLTAQRRVREALRVSGRFVAAHAASVASLSLLNGMAFLIALGAYGAFDIRTRGSACAWTAIVVGQLYILARLTVRLLTAASQVELVRRLRPAPSDLPRGTLGTL